MLFCQGISLSEFYAEVRYNGLSYTDLFAMNLLLLPNAASIVGYVALFYLRADDITDMCSAFKASRHIKFTNGERRARCFSIKSFALIGF